MSKSVSVQRIYKAIEKQVFIQGAYSIVPIRYEDRYQIMQWRNDQIYHLRQSKPLSKEEQDQYFDNVIPKLFDESEPNQLLFSYLKDDICIGYGGLVHLNWKDKHAEISFLMNTSLEKLDFEIHWSQYLELIEEVAFGQLGFNKIFTYAFDLRPRLYRALNSRGFKKEAQLKSHVLFDNSYVDVLIHAKYNPYLTLKKATETDLELTFQWAKNKMIRQFAISQSEITLEEHSQWFRKKLDDSNCTYLIVCRGLQAIGSFRLDVQSKIGKISYLLDPCVHGMGLGIALLERGIEFCKEHKLAISIQGEVFEQNIASVKVFEKLNFQRIDQQESGLILFEKDIL